MSQIVAKPWGRELILTPEGLPYTAKCLELKAGQKLSLQYHDLKDETLTLISGQASIVTGQDVASLTTTPMTPFEGCHIAPGVIHRIIADTDCQVFEASTGEIGTTFRLEDDTHRPNETPDIRNLPNRGWNP